MTIWLLLPFSWLLFVQIDRITWTPHEKPQTDRSGSTRTVLITLSILISLTVLPIVTNRSLQPLGAIDRFLASTTTSFAVALGLLLFHLPRESQSFRHLGFRLTSDRNLLLAVLSYLLFLPTYFVSVRTNVLVWQYSQKIFHPPDPVRFFLDEAQQGQWEKAAGIILLVLLLGPLIEEIIFRGFLFTRLRAYGSQRTALLASALIFSISHLDPSNLLPLTALGLLLGWTYQKTGSILAPIWIHILHNAFTFGLSLAPLFDSG
ncbi:MAG: CPBP family intramembrane metalloprotease [Planctomycetota bacterium]|nr:CPBP family intramembrane metalloprotease [Planctomycetota bacterium]